MAPPRKLASSLKKTALYYRSHPEARKKKKETDTKVNRRPEQRKKRTQLKRSNRKADKAGVNRSGKDASHQKDGSIKYTSSSKNRGNGSTTAGDRRARGKKKK